MLDTCVVIDFLQKRGPFADDALRLFRAAACELFSGYITAKSVNDIYYIDHKYTHDDAESRKRIRSLLTVIGMLDSTATDVFQAFESGISDFEDAVMVETAKRTAVDCIVTRIIRDYVKAPVPVYSPGEFLKHLISSEDDSLA